MGGSAPPPPDYGPLAEAQKESARMQKETADKQLAAWKEKQAQIRADYAPYRQMGARAVARIKENREAGKYDLAKWEGGEFKAPSFDDYFDPKTFKFRKTQGYKFRVAEGEKAIRRAAAAGSGGRSGAAYKALMSHGQKMASQEYDKEYGRAYQHALMRYQTDRQGMLDERTASIQDWQLGNQRIMNQYNLDAAPAQMGLSALNQGTSAGLQAQHQQTNLAQFGTAALAAGNIGAQQALVNQQQEANNLYMQHRGQNLGLAGSIIGGLAGVF